MIGDEVVSSGERELAPVSSFLRTGNSTGQRKLKNGWTLLLILSFP